MNQMPEKGENEPSAQLRVQVERKLTLYLIVPIALITFVNSMDRVNVSYAGSAMSADLGLSPDQFGQGVSMFFVAYLLFQYPHVRLLRAWGIKLWLLVSILLVAASGLWMAHVASAAEFYAARFLLGTAEALWTPSGSMANLIALTSHLSRGDAFLAPAGAHVLDNELGTAAWLAGGMPRALPHDAGPGKISPDAVRRAAGTPGPSGGGPEISPSWNSRVSSSSSASARPARSPKRR